MDAPEIEMWFIVVWTLTDNEYVSLLVSPQAPQAQNTWYATACVYRELYGKINNGKKNSVNNYLNSDKVFLPQMCRQLISCADSKAILTPFWSRYLKPSLLLK